MLQWWAGMKSTLGAITFPLQTSWKCLNTLYRGQGHPTETAVTSETPKEAAFDRGRGLLLTTACQTWRLAPSLPQNTGERGVMLHPFQIGMQTEKLMQSIFG